MPEVVSEYYLENKSGNHNKFYEIKIQQNGRGTRPFQVVCRWGRIGSNGRTTLKGAHAYESSAQSEATNLVNEKKAKGYVLVDKAKLRHAEAKEAKKRDEETMEDILLNRFGDILE